DDVRLLDDLEPVDDQRVVVQQQRALLHGRRRQIPHLPLEEVLVLRVDLQPLVVGDVHVLRAAGPLRDLRLLELEVAHEALEASGRCSRTRRHHHAAWRRLSRAITLVKRLLLTTVLYSSGPVTPWMWNFGSSRPSQNPRSSHMRAVSTRISMPSRTMKSSSPVALTYLHSAKAMSALMWYCAVPAA